MEDVLQLLRQLFILGQDSAAAGMFLYIYQLILTLVIFFFVGRLWIMVVKGVSAALQQFLLKNDGKKY